MKDVIIDLTVNHSQCKKAYTRTIFAGYFSFFCNKFTGFVRKIKCYNSDNFQNEKLTNYYVFYKLFYIIDADI